MITQLSDWSRRMKRKSYWAWLGVRRQPSFPTASAGEKKRAALLGIQPNAPWYAPCFPKKRNSLKGFQNLLHHLPWICKFYRKLDFFNWENILFPPCANSPHIYLPTGSLFVKISHSPCSDLLLFLKVGILTYSSFKPFSNSPFCDSAMLP